MFLNHSLGLSPEDDLLLQIQGVVAEYERAQNHRAQPARQTPCRPTRNHQCPDRRALRLPLYGRNAGGGAGPLRGDRGGSRGGPADLPLDWPGSREHRRGCRRLERAGHRTRTGRSRWTRGVIWHMLKNPAYKGQAGFGKTRSLPRPTGSGRCVAPARRPAAATTLPALPPRSGSRFRSRRSSMPTSSTSSGPTCGEPSPRSQRRPGRALPAARAGRLPGVWVRLLWPEDPAQSRNRSRPRLRLLSLRWQRCLAFWRPACLFQSAGSHRHSRCGGLAGSRAVAPRSGPSDGGIPAPARPQPSRIPRRSSDRVVEAQMAKLRRSIERLIDSYANEVIDKDEFEPRIRTMRQRLQILEDQKHHLADEAATHRTLSLIVGQLSDFAEKVTDRLAEAHWHLRRDLIAPRQAGRNRSPAGQHRFPRGANRPGSEQTQPAQRWCLPDRRRGVRIVRGLRSNAHSYRNSDNVPPGSTSTAPRTPNAGWFI